MCDNIKDGLQPVVSHECIYRANWILWKSCFELFLCLYLCVMEEIVCSVVGEIFFCVFWGGIHAFIATHSKGYVCWFTRTYLISWVSHIYACVCARACMYAICVLSVMFVNVSLYFRCLAGQGNVNQSFIPAKLYTRMHSLICMCTNTGLCCCFYFHVNIMIF